LHRGARRGVLQARRERRAGPQVPEVLIEAGADIVEKEIVSVIAICHPVSPAVGGGLPPPFIGQGGSSLHACRTISLRVEVWRAMLRS
jgi:hypothetical protein